jgi:hypothetical protein
MKPAQVALTDTGRNDLLRVNHSLTVIVLF